MSAMILPTLVFLAAYALIASEKVDKTLVAMIGAFAVCLFGFIPYEEAMAKVDLNVLFLLAGMMIVIQLIGSTGAFEWLAIMIAKKAGGRGLPILVLFLTATAVCSAFLDNVTTVILMAPATILVCQLLELPAPLFLTLEAIFSNLGGTATLVGDPPNILIGSQAHRGLPTIAGRDDLWRLGFGDFIAHLTLPVVVIGAVALAVIAFWGRRRLFVSEAARRRIDAARPELAILHPARLRKTLIVSCLILAGFFFGRFIGLEPGLTALGGAFLMALWCGSEPAELLEKVEWCTIFFFIGLFILIGALEHVGLFERLGLAMMDATGGRLLPTALAVLWASAFISAVVDNIPLVIAMIPLLHTVVTRFALRFAAPEADVSEFSSEQIQAMIAELSPEKLAMLREYVHLPLFWCLALGACLGGNGSLVGASANVVAAQLARRNGYKLTFMQFTRVGLPIMLLSLLISTAFIYFRYFIDNPLA